MDGEHFIVIYGSGTTPEADPEDAICDGVVTAGYDTWPEFIAHYYAVRLVDGENLEFANMSNSIINLLGEVNVHELIGGKKPFSMICSHWLNCTDFLETLNWLSNPGVLMSADEPYGADAQQSLFQCLEFLYKQMQKDKPWKIDEDFIHTFGTKFSMFRLMNSFYLGIIES